MLEQRERARGLSPGLPGLCNKDIPEGSLSEEAMEAERSKTKVIKLTVALINRPICSKLRWL